MCGFGCTHFFVLGGEKSMDKPQCPICGKEIDDEEYACLDNGSPAHYECAEKESNYKIIKEN